MKFELNFLFKLLLKYKYNYLIYNINKYISICWPFGNTFGEHPLGMVIFDSGLTVYANVRIYQLVHFMKFAVERIMWIITLVSEVFTIFERKESGRQGMRVVREWLGLGQQI